MIKNGVERKSGYVQQLRIESRGYIVENVARRNIDLSRVHYSYNDPKYSGKLVEALGQVGQSIVGQYENGILILQGREGPLAPIQVFERSVKPRLDLLVQGAEFAAHHTFPGSFGGNVAEEGSLADFTNTQRADFYRGKLAVDLALDWTGTVPYTIAEIARLERVPQSVIERELGHLVSPILKKAPVTAQELMILDKEKLV